MGGCGKKKALSDLTEDLNTEAKEEIIIATLIVKILQHELHDLNTSIKIAKLSGHAGFEIRVE